MLKKISLSILIATILYIVFIHKSITRDIGLGVTIASTPHISPYKDEVIRASRRIINGDSSENTALEIMHGNMSARLMGNLHNRSEWHIIRTSKGLIALHNKFLEIENAHSLNNKGVNYSRELMIRYLDTYSRYRSSYSEIYKKVMLQGPDESQNKTINEMAEHLFSREILNSGTFILIAVPFEDRSGTISPWVAMHEAGIVFASYDKNHDFLSQLNEYKIAHPNLTENEIVDRLAAHEGSHGDIEAMIAYVLKLRLVNPIYEGIPGALSRQTPCDGTSGSSVLLQLGDMVSTLKTNSRTDVAYQKGTCFWSTIFSLTKSDSVSTVDTWAHILSVGLHTSLEVTAAPDTFFKLSEDQRISAYFKKLIYNLEIDVQGQEDTF